MPCESGMIGEIKECAEGMQGELHSHGVHASSFKAKLLVTKLRKAGFSVRAPLSPKHGGCTNNHYSGKWQSAYTVASTGSNGMSSKFNEVSAEVKDLIPWVRIIAQKIHRPLPPNIMLNDLVQDGMVGLIMAFKEHDAGLGVPFHAFAANKIRWAIMDGLRAGDWAGVSVRRRAKKVATTTEKLQGLLHREPSKSEIAEDLGLCVDDITTTLGDVYGCNFVRIDDGVEGEAQDIPDLRMEPSSIVEQREIYSRAVASLRVLQPKERKAFVLRIMCDMNGQQAASEMGLSESRVSQLYKTATAKLATNVSHWKFQNQ